MRQVEHLYTSVLLLLVYTFSTVVLHFLQSLILRTASLLYQCRLFGQSYSFSTLLLSTSLLYFCLILLVLRSITTFLLGAEWDAIFVMSKSNIWHHLSLHTSCKRVSVLLTLHFKSSIVISFLPFKTNENLNMQKFLNNTTFS